MCEKNTLEQSLSNESVRKETSPTIVAKLCYKILFMLNSVEHDILNAHKNKIIKKFGFFRSDKPRMLYFPLKMLKCQQLLAF